MFVMIDHASGEAWADAGLRMDRFAAADLLREVTSERFGSVEQAVAAGLALRYDGGPCFRSEHYQVEIDHLGIARSPAYHYEPETNGCAEKFIQTLKEQILWIERFATFEELRARVREFTATYNEHWLLERPRLPHTSRGTRAPPRARPDGRGMITLFTKVSGAPEPGQSQPLRHVRTRPIRSDRRRRGPVRCARRGSSASRARPRRQGRRWGNWASSDSFHPCDWHAGQSAASE